MAAPFDLAMTQGETFERAITWKRDGVAQDLRLWTLAAQIRERASVNARLLLDLEPYLTVDPDGLRVVLSIPGQVLARLEAQRFLKAGWDLFATNIADPDDVVQLLYGSATMRGEVTDTRGL